MAAATEHSNRLKQCGFCMEQGNQLVEPRILPCQHIHCYPCLVGDFETNRIVRCGKCKAVFDVTLDRLPVAVKREDKVQVCDVCVQKGITNESAVKYCTDCGKRICIKHLESHEDFFPQHKKLLGTEGFQGNARMYAVRKCTKHEDQPITLACSSCYIVLCVECMEGSKDCDKGSTHQAVHLNQLVKLLKVKREKLKVDALGKEGELSTLLKHSTKVFSDYERSTEELIRRLHGTRDEQLTELRRKYDNLERELLESRRRSKEQLINFLEREVGLRLTEINTLLLLQDAKFKDAHQVDSAEGYAATANEIQRFIDEDLPSLKLTNQRALSTQARMRDIELKMVDAVDIPVSRRLLPISLELKNVVCLWEFYWTKRKVMTLMFMTCV
ncbi:transcription intermediary factor 1-beta-like isoform X2 [Watersipora subatra]|uniref:transcription intermediary factor 1-beta-like isoform X2 n=1 Tax=Watersipora subatra TaxID=2589382 RepID=UPI00355B3E46